MRHRVCFASLCALIVFVLSVSAENISDDSGVDNQKWIHSGDTTTIKPAFLDEAGEAIAVDSRVTVDTTTDGILTNHPKRVSKKYKSKKKKSSCHYKKRRHRLSPRHRKSNSTVTPSPLDDADLAEIQTDATDVRTPDTAVEGETEAPVVKKKTHHHYKRKSKRKHRSRCHRKYSKSGRPKIKSTPVYGEGHISSRSNLDLSEEYTDDEHESDEHIDDKPPVFAAHVPHIPASIKFD